MTIVRDGEPPVGGDERRDNSVDTETQPPRPALRLSALATGIFVGGLILIVGYVLLTRLYQIIYLFLAAFAIAYALEPLVQRLQRHGWSRRYSVWTVFSGLVLVIGLIIWAFVPALVAQAMGVADNWESYSAQVVQLYGDLTTGTEAWLRERVPGLGGLELLNLRIPAAEEWAAENIPAVLTWISEQLVASIAVLGLGVILLILTFHFMSTGEALRATVRKLIPQHQTENVDQVSVEIGAMLEQYLRGCVILFFANGIGAAIIMYAVGLFFGSEYALVVGLLTGLTNMVPYLGPIISAGSGAILVYVSATSNPIVAALVAAGCLFVMSQYFGAIEQPRLIGRKINLDPLVILFAMFGGYELFGFLGVIIGIPIAGCLKIILAKWVPVIGSPPSVRAPKEPLLLDMPQGARNAWRFLQRVYGWLEAEPVSASTQSRSEQADQRNDRGAAEGPEILTGDGNEED